MVMRTKSYFKPISIPLYRTYTFIVINMSDEELEEKLEQFIPSKKEIKEIVKDSRVDKGYQAMTAYADGYSIVRYNHIKDIQDLNIIAHESFHVTCCIMRYVDIPLSEDSEEAFAYLLGYITEQYQELIEILK
jgi:hypothetical protein